MARRTARGEVHQVILRIPITQYAELITLVPDIVGANGYTRYGATQQYFTSLMNQDLERRRSALRQLQPTSLDGGKVVVPNG